MSARRFFEPCVGMSRRATAPHRFDYLTWSLGYSLRISRRSLAQGKRYDWVCRKELKG